ncbi:hypothetical protein [Flavobacterium olei]|uniref:hypothetical protein n=1 Tax=Flavobacterium olei TaxID=1886782 RepID=UPI00321A1E18
MIKILKSDFELKQMANRYYSLLESEFTLSKKADDIVKDHRLAAYERDFFRKLRKNLRKIIVSPPDVLAGLQTEIHPLYQSYISKKTHGLHGNKLKAAVKKANDKIFTVFDYKSFTKRKDGRFAYQFTENMDINVCVYCNRQYTFTLNVTDGKCRPTLDHFLDKSKHPYFALSFYNLIPSCYTCNSSLKNQKKFTFKDNLHPYSHSMFEILDFSIDINNVDFVDGSKKDFEIFLKESTHCKDKSLLAKAQKNASAFKLQEIYRQHKDYASEIILKSYYYDATRIDELFGFKTSSGKKLFESRTEVLEFALGNYISEKKLGKKVLSKFTRDLAFDLGLDKLI